MIALVWWPAYVGGLGRLLQRCGGTVLPALFADEAEDASAVAAAVDASRLRAADAEDEPVGLQTGSVGGW